MRPMVTAEFGSDFLNVETTKDGDMAEITGEGEYVELEYKGKKRTVLNLPVKLNGQKDLIYTPTNKVGRQLVKAWGSETKEWLGKKLQILHYDDQMLVKPM